MKVVLTEANFSTVINSSKPVLIYFRSDFCGSCKAQSYVLEQLEGTYNEEILLGEVNCHEHADWTEAFGVQSTPTLLLFYKKGMHARLTGVHSLNQIKQIMRKAVTLD